MRHHLIATVSCAALSMQALAADQWTYTHFSPSGRALNTGVAEVSQPAGKATLSMFSYHEYADPCYAKKSMDATVVQESEFTVVTTQNMVRGCAPIRLKIRNDGAGGQQELLVNGEWVWDKLEHGLVRK